MREEGLIVSDVVDELCAEPAINADRISVSPAGGTIVLSGSVDSYREKELAEHAALRVMSVRAVANEIVVEVPGDQQRTDQEIADAAEGALRRNAAVPEDAVQVTVPRQPGVSDIKLFIADGLKRSALVDARHIAIDEQDGRVILRGTARSWAERSEAERVAWTGPGVSDVENHIAVGIEAPHGESGLVLDHIERSGALPAGVSAGEAAGATLCVLSQRVSADEARELMRFLPAEVSGLVRPCARHRGSPTEVFDRDGFLRRVGDHLVVSEQESERITHAVFEAVRMWLPARDVREVAVQLPEDLRDLWHSVRAG
jgi:osmotically-inducible protein OsmY/uncharacterized protein (DUF2267 family)